MTKASGLLWHDVPNRGGALPNYAAQAPERALGDVNLMSAWQGDNAAATTVRSTMAVTGTHFLQLPLAKGEAGSLITGDVFGRIINRSGPASQPLIVQTNPVPYNPISLDTTKSTLVSRRGESTRGEVIGETLIAANDWAWAKCDATNPFPGTPDATQICLKNGFEIGRASCRERV